MAHFRMLYKNPEVDIRRKYRRWLHFALIVSLLLMTILFYSFQKFEHRKKLSLSPLPPIKLVKPPKTTQPKKPVPPRKPVIPVEAEGDEDSPEDFIFPTTEIDFSSLMKDIPQPYEEPEPEYEFVAIEHKPRVIKRVAPVYPELAKKVGAEGLVVLKVLINTKGDVEKVKVIKSNPLLDEAAITAVRQFKFQPGKQRDRYVKVWMSIPFRFRLR
jgi:protein TonB